MKTCIGAAVAALSLAAAPAVAQTNVALGKSVTGTPYYDAGTETFTYANLTDGDLDDTGQPGDWSFWLTPNGQTGTAVIDLGGLYTLTDFFVQNTLNRGYHDREAHLVDFYVGTEAPTLGIVASYGTLVDSVDFADTNPLINSATFTIAPTVGRYITVDLRSFYGNSGGLNEVQAFGTAVPEPATWAMMALGFGLVGAGLRSRRTAGVRLA